jgi:Mn-dependent DtxR family transcriptional regulator
VIDKFIKKKRALKQVDIIKALGYSQRKIMDCIERLQDKGYLHKTER